MHDIITLHRRYQELKMHGLHGLQWRLQDSLPFHVYISIYLRTTCVFWCFGVLATVNAISSAFRVVKIGWPSFGSSASQLQFLRKSLACHGQLGVLSTLAMTGQVNAQKMPTLVLYVCVPVRINLHYDMGAWGLAKAHLLPSPPRAIAKLLILGAFYPKPRSSWYELDEERQKVQRL